MLRSMSPTVRLGWNSRRRSVSGVRCRRSRTRLDAPFAPALLWGADFLTIRRARCAARARPDLRVAIHSPRRDSTQSAARRFADYKLTKRTGMAERSEIWRLTRFR